MSAEIIVFGAMFVVGCWLQLRYGVFEVIWNAIKSGLYWIARPHKIERRTPNQKRFNTKLSWPQVRWSIARMEHEMFPSDQWTHDVKDCVDPACNPNFLRQMYNDKIITLPAPPRFPDPGRTEKR